jgi:hypothetical protein
MVGKGGGWGNVGVPQRVEIGMVGSRTGKHPEQEINIPV